MKTSSNLMHMHVVKSLPMFSLPVRQKVQLQKKHSLELLRQNSQARSWRHIQIINNSKSHATAELRESFLTVSRVRIHVFVPLPEETCVESTSAGKPSAIF